MDNIYGFMSLNLFSLVIIIIISILFFSKKRLHQVEDKIYSFFLISNIFATISGIILGLFVSPNFIGKTECIKIMNKIYLFFLLIWGSLLTYYTVYISKIKNKNNQKKYYFLKKFSLILLALSEIFLLVLPVNVIVSTNGAIASGLSIIYLYSYMAILLLIDILCILTDYRNISSKKYYPIYMLIVLGGITITTQLLFPNLNYLINPCTVLITFLMYHTIENPDMKMIEQLNTAKDAAEKANRAKSDFLSSMSHEIRTPLNAIVGFSECILKENDLESAKNDAKDIIMASQNLLEIVNGVLDISKIEADKMEIVESEYNLRDNMDSLAKLMIPRIGEKPIEFKTKFAPDIPVTLYGDVAKIKQIVSNILTNAVKYTDRGIINFEVNCINKDNTCSLVISVEDTGRGIPSDKIDSIFNKFERLEEDRNTTLEGTGLGLAITKRLVEMMGGKIVVQSKYGAGSKFTVYLKQEIRNTPVKQEKTYSVTVANADFSNKKVLVVDDNRINLKVAKRMLEPFKLTVEECESGEECINKIKDGAEYDLIFMDDMMPKITGTETFHELEKVPTFKTPVVVLTANAVAGMREKYLQEGFVDYLAKPIDKLELERVLGTFLAHTNKEEKEDIFGPLPEELFDINIPLNKEDE